MFTQKEIYEALSLKTALFMVLLSVPALALSLYGAMFDDGAFTPVMVQGVLFLFLVIAAMTSIPLSYKQRLLITTAVIFIAGSVAVFRYANVTVGYTYSLIITLMTTLILPRVGVYLLLALMNFLVGVVAVALFELSLVRVLLQFVTFTGLTAIGLEIIFTLIGFHRQQAAKIGDEQKRQEAASAHANIAFMEFDYKRGLLEGDETNAKRFGRSVSDGPISLNEYAHLFPSDSWELTQSKIAEAAKKPVGYTSSFVHFMDDPLDGQLHHYSVSGVNLDRDGQLVFMGVSLDITEQLTAMDTVRSLDEVVKAEHQLRTTLELTLDKFDSIADDTRIAFWWLDLETNLVTYSRSFAQRWGLTTGGTITFDEHLSLMSDRLKRTVSDAVSAVVKTREQFTEVFQASDPRLESRWFRMVISPYVNAVGEVSQIYGTTIDVTPLMTAQSELEEKNRELAEHAAKRNQLFGMVAHELRTPVAAIKLMASGGSDSDWLARKGDVRRSSEDLLNSIDDMRLLINPELERPVRVEPFTLDQLNRSVSASVASFVAASAFSFKQVEALAPDLKTRSFATDTYRVRIALSNLIKNACMHSRGSEVLMESAVERDNSGQKYFVWTVSDDGIGIPAEQVERLFEFGARGDTHSEGSGLGLHITRSWIEEIGGDVEYIPRDPRGSCFRLRIPQASALAEKNSADAVNELRGDLQHAMAALKVLIVEDDLLLQELLKDMLEPLLGQIEVANNGLEALKVLDDSFDMVLTDYFMPEMLGTDFIRQAKARSYNGVIIGLTAATIGSQREEMLQAGAERVLCKPLEEAVFLQLMEDLFASERLGNLLSAN